MAESLPSLPPLLLALQPQRDASILAVEEAWKIALTWCDRLRDKVLLERDPDESSGVAKSYKWIRFIDISIRDEVCAARAAAVTWFALSCCSGYGGDENPVFWKCVFSEHAHHHIGRGIQEVQSITDAYGFFDEEGVDFPRFALRSGANEAHVLLFCGHASQKLRHEDKLALNQITDALLPWVDYKRTARRPDVSLGNVPNALLTQRCGQIAKLGPRQETSQSVLSLFISESNRSTATEWSSPVFLVKELDITIGAFDKQRNNLQSLHEVLYSHDVEIASFACLANGSNLSRDELATTVQAVLCLPGSGSRARTTKLFMGREDSLWWPAFASALPKTTSIRSLIVNVGRDFFEKNAIVWIAYALLHPDTPSSPWNSLVLQGARLNSRCLDVMHAMARGNNLAAMLEGRDATSDGYYRARLAAKAVVYDVPAMSLLHRFKRTAIVTSDGTLEVEVCDVASGDPKTWSKWVAVVVPAYGLGWCRSAEVACVVKRPPAEASLVHLHVSTRLWDPSRCDEAFQGVLSIIGRRLVHLDLGEYKSFPTPALLAETLSWCPSLESLAVKHNGELWTTEDAERVLPRLRELRLHLDFHPDGWEKMVAFHVPRSLRMLCIKAVGATEKYAGSADALQFILSQSSQLRVFHWADGLSLWREFVASHHPTPYTETRTDTYQRLGELALPSTSYVDTRLPPSCMAAFLSVVDASDGPLSRLDQELLKMIVVFAGSRMARSIVLEPSTLEVPRDREKRRPAVGRI